MFRDRSIKYLTACLLSVGYLCVAFGHADEDPPKKPSEAPVEIPAKPADKPAADPANPVLEKRFSRPVLIRFEGVITPMTEHYLFRKLELARKQRADLVVIEIESPGGMLKPSQAIGEHLRDVKWAHTVAFVPHEALSGAAIMSLGCDELIMHRQAKIGDAGAIYQDDFGMFQHVPEKIRSHLARVVRDLAASKQRPPALAEAMVDKDLSVFRVRNKETGRETCMSEGEIKDNAQPDQWEKIAPIQEAGAGNFFEVNGTRAVELRFAQGIAQDRTELSERYQLDTPWTVMQPGDMETIVYILNLPFITGVLIVAGLVGLYFEFCAPGTCIGGLVGTLCFTLFFWSRFLGGTSGWLEVLLFIVGAGFFAAEIFVLPGFGIAGIAGLALMGTSLVMASQEFVVPETVSQMNSLGTTVMVLACSATTFLVLAIVISSRLKSIPGFGHLILAPPTSALRQTSHASTPPFRGNEGSADDRPSPAQIQVGDQGVAVSTLRPAGKARFDSRYVDVATDGSFVDKDAPIQVVRVQGNYIVVREVKT